MRDLFQEQLNELNRELTMMGSSCEEIIALASDALTNWNEELVRKVDAIGTRIDESECTGDHCTNIAEWVEFSVTGVHKDCQ